MTRPAPATRGTGAVGAAAATLAALVVLGGCAGSDEPTLLADSMAGSSFSILEADGSPMVWVSSEDGSDPRSGGAPDPGLCTLSGGGSPRLVEPEHGDSRLGDTTLFAVAQIEDLEPPATISCAGGNVKHVYVGTP